MNRKIYVASSWRNKYHEDVVKQLTANNHAVYDFRNPPGRTGFAWREIDPNWEAWDPLTYRHLLLNNELAEAGFQSDWKAMEWADTCVLVLPCGRSAHIEAGYFVGAKKDLFILVPERMEPELMYKMATRICLTVPELISIL